MSDHLAVLENARSALFVLRTMLRKECLTLGQASVNELIADVEAAIALMRGQSWQPIETAPRDGSGIFAWWGSDSKAFGIRSFGVTLFRNGEWRDPDDEDETYGEPTHWQPLDPPKDTADEQ